MPAEDNASQVATSGCDGHLEFLSQFGSGHLATSLHQQQGGHEAISAH